MKSYKYTHRQFFLQPLVATFLASFDSVGKENLYVILFLYAKRKAEKSSVRRRVDASLDRLSDKELSVIETTVNELCKAKEQTEE